MHILIQLLALTIVVKAQFSPDFQQFLTNTYGQELSNWLLRPDLGADGSYGGGPNTNGKRPVIILHGTIDHVLKYEQTRIDLMNADWTKENIFGSTYGPGVYSEVGRLAESQKCDYARKARRMIEAVHAYRNSKVDVLGFSLGAPIGRKAILGGACVDTGEDLGPPITHLVQNFISVAGSNHGSNLCFIPSPVPYVCNGNNGVYCGSAFLNDINAPQYRYEGTYAYSIASHSDDVIGDATTCGYHPAVFVGGEMVWHTGLNHVDTLFETYKDIIRLLSAN